MKKRWRPWREGAVFHTPMAHQLIAEVGDASPWLDYFDSICKYSDECRLFKDICQM